MSGDELLVFMGAIGVALWYWPRWYILCARSGQPAPRRGLRLLLVLLPPAALVAMLVVLLTLASFDVREDALYLAFYSILALAWIPLTKALFQGATDIRTNEDALQNNNAAATLAVAGAFVGGFAIYAGANIGDGPGWWCVAVAGGIGLVAWIALAWLAVRLADLAEKITVNRDPDAGLRFGAYLAASGFVCGRGAAGDWTSLVDTLIEFSAAWPVLVLAAALIALELWLFPRIENAPTKRFASIAFSVLLVGGAVAAILLGPALPQNEVYSR